MGRRGEDDEKYWEFNKKIRERDLSKKQSCTKNGINLLYYSHDKEDTFLDEKTIKDINKLKNILHQHNG